MILIVILFVTYEQVTLLYTKSMPKANSYKYHKDNLTNCQFTFPKTKIDIQSLGNHINLIHNKKVKLSH